MFDLNLFSFKYKLCVRNLFKLLQSKLSIIQGRGFKPPPWLVEHHLLLCDSIVNLQVLYHPFLVILSFNHWFSIAGKIIAMLGTKRIAKGIEYRFSIASFLNSPWISSSHKQAIFFPFHPSWSFLTVLFIIFSVFSIQQPLSEMRLKNLLCSETSRFIL